MNVNLTCVSVLLFVLLRLWVHCDNRYEGMLSKNCHWMVAWIANVNLYSMNYIVPSRHVSTIAHTITPIKLACAEYISSLLLPLFAFLQFLGKFGGRIYGFLSVRTVFHIQQLHFLFGDK